MKQNELFSYGYDFVSQLLDNKMLFDSIKRIIFFGSVVRGDFSKGSDIDLFIDLKSLKEYKKINDLIKKEINKFETRCEKTWFLREINLPIKIIVGNLEQEKWKDLREEILSYGKIVYGKFERLPEKLEHKLLVTYEIKKLSQKKKMSFLRRLYGYVVKKKEKKYIQKGLIDEIKGEKISPNALMIRAEDLLRVKKILKEYKIKYWLRDIWSKHGLL